MSIYYLQSTQMHCCAHSFEKISACMPLDNFGRYFYDSGDSALQWDNLLNVTRAPDLQEVSAEADCRSRLIWGEGEENEIRRADTTHSGVTLTASSCRQKFQLQDESHLVTDSLVWYSWFLSFLLFGAEYLPGAESANCSTELLETNLISGGWQPALRNQQPTEDWWSILMLQLHWILPWVPCSAGGWAGRSVKGTSLAWTASRRRLIEEFLFTTQELERHSYSNIEKVWSSDSNAHPRALVLFGLLVCLLPRGAV